MEKAKYEGLTWAKEISRYELRGFDESVRKVLKKKEEEVRKNIEGELVVIDPIKIELDREIRIEQVAEDLEKILDKK